MDLEHRVKRYPESKKVAAQILSACRDGRLPEALAQRYLQGYDYPALSYSIRNQLVLNLQGDPDARGYKAWRHVQRHVKKGQKARYVLAPRLGRSTVVDDEETGQQTRYRPVIGWRNLPVFGYDQTDGAPLADREEADKRATTHLETLPLREVAKEWGLSISYANDSSSTGRLGWYSPLQSSITLGVRNLSTWAHELVHAADDRAGHLGALTPKSRADAEIVAELGGAVLLTVLGHEKHADLGGCWQYLQRYAGPDVLMTVDRLLDRSTGAVDMILAAASAVEARY